MNKSHRKGAWHRQPITAENVSTVQERFEKELQLHEKSRTVLNGRVKSNDDHEEGTDSRSDTCLEYEFLYSVSDEEHGDYYSYEFDAYPVTVNNKKSDDEVKQEILHISTNETGLENGNGRPVNRRIQSSKHSISQKHGTVVPERPKSESTLREGRKISTVSFQNNNEIHGEESKERIQNRKISTTSKASSCNTTKTGSSKDKADYQRRKSVAYDPALEKACVFIHGGGKNFSRANTSLTPVKYGMRHLQMNYTETNLETNQTVIFLDLLKNSHQKNYIRRQQIRSIERRLEARRNNPLYSTSYYEHKHLTDPFQRNVKKTARSAAQKKIERDEKIKKMTDEIQTGYVPTQLTMKIADQKEVEEIGRSCRYLRYHRPEDD